LSTSASATRSSSDTLSDSADPLRHLTETIGELERGDLAFGP
jgi:hypothetical protein